MAASFLGASLCRAQERPLQVNGIFSTGYYDTYTRDSENHSVAFVPVGAKFDIRGYWMMPDFLSFSAQPELNYGPQASDAGFEGGNGIRLNLTFLRRRSFPLTFRYSNLQMEDVYFGGLSQVSAYSLKNRNKDLGLTWELKPVNLPSLMIDWGKGSTDSRSDIALIPDYKSHINHVNADSRYERWGWNLDGFAHWQKHDSDLFAPLGVGTNTSSLQQTVTQYQGAGQRSIWDGADLHLLAGGQSTSSILYGLPIYLTSYFANASLRVGQNKRWKGSLRAGYTSNLSTQFLEQILSTLGNGGPGTIAPDQSILTPLHQNISNVNVNGNTTYDLSHGWGLFASADHSALLSSSQQGVLGANYLTASAGITYAGSFRWGRLSGQYGREFGLGSVTGQSGTIQGQNYLANVTSGTPDRLQVEFSVRGADQNIQNALPMTSHNLAFDANVARHVAGRFSARIGGGWQNDFFQNVANEFRAHGYTARAELSHPRIQVTASLDNTLGNSLPIYSQLVNGNPAADLLLTPLSIIPSDYRGASFTAHANPTRKIEFSATYTRSRQHLDGVLNNDFQLLIARATYHFRRLEFDAGYIFANQIFSGLAETRRGLFYIRISRGVRVL